MERIQKILNHPLYQEQFKLLQDAEKDREFCRHTMEHFVDVARLMYIYTLEEKTNVSKELIYAAALLHDIGQLAISTKAEVLDADRKPVPGLYAGGTLGNAELFYMRYAVSGSSMCMGTVTGRIAAQSALEYYGA